MTEEDSREIRIGFPGPSGVPIPAADNPGGVEGGGGGKGTHLSGSIEDPTEERRRFLRVAKTVDFELGYLDSPLAASMIDISEGGLRCRVEPGYEFDPEKVLRIRVDLGDGDLEVRGLVSWKKLLDGSIEVGVAFVELTEREMQKIRSHVFAVQLAERRADRSHHGHHHHRGTRPGRRR